MQLTGLIREIFKDRLVPKKVIFRVDAGSLPGLSFGHICRCLVLAKELKKNFGVKNIFLMRDYPEGVTFVKSYGHTVRTLTTDMPQKKHDSKVVEYISNTRPDCLMVDLPDEDPNFYLNYARRNQIFTVCIDDTARRSYQADVILNSSILAVRNKYSLCLPTTRFLLGMDYFIMDDYLAKRRSVTDKRYISVLITFGGSDPTGLTEKTVRALAGSSWDNVKFNVILGPGFNREKLVIEYSHPLCGKVAILRYPKNIRKLFLESDLVICAGGRTLYELYKIGKPTFAIASTKNEDLVIRRFIRNKLLLSGMSRWHKQNFIKKLKSIIFKFKK